MAKAGAIFSVFCILALATIAHSTEDEFHVNGYVYCDPCRVEFEIGGLSERIEGATVKLECRNVTTETVTYTVEGTTSKDGQYTLTAQGDHGEEICQVVPVKSGREDCKAVLGGSDSEKAIVILTKKSGMVGTERFANPLGFSTDSAIDGCKEALDKLALGPLEEEEFIN